MPIMIFHAILILLIISISKHFCTNNFENRNNRDDIYLGDDFIELALNPKKTLTKSQTLVSDTNLTKNLQNNHNELFFQNNNYDQCNEINDNILEKCSRNDSKFYKLTFLGSSNERKTTNPYYEINLDVSKQSLNNDSLSSNKKNCVNFNKKSEKNMNTAKNFFITSENYVSVKNHNFFYNKRYFLKFKKIVKMIDGNIVEINDYFYQITDPFCLINNEKNKNFYLTLYVIAYQIEKKIRIILDLYVICCDLNRLSVKNVSKDNLKSKQNIPIESYENFQAYKNSKSFINIKYKPYVFNKNNETISETIYMHSSASKEFNIIKNYNWEYKFFDGNNFNMKIKLKYDELFEKLKKRKTLNDFLNLGVQIIFEIKKDFFESQNYSIMVVLISYLTFSVKIMNETIEKIYVKNQSSVNEKIYDF